MLIFQIDYCRRNIWEPGHEATFKATWNLYCQKNYKEILYKWRKKDTRPSHVLVKVWDAWQNIWIREKQQHNSVAARNNRNIDIDDPDTRVTKQTVRSHSMVEHALQMVSL